MNLAFVLQLLTFAAPSEAMARLEAAIAKLKTTPSSCADTLGPRLRAARLQLELAVEVNEPQDPAAIEIVLRDLAAEAKRSCPATVADDLEAALRGLATPAHPPDEDDALLAPEPPPAAPEKEPAFPFPQRGLTDLEKRLSALAPTLLPSGFAPTNVVLKGAGKRVDWAPMLEAGKCYAFVAVTPPDTRKVALYLWDIFGKRRATRKARAATAVMYYCPFTTGSVHVQAKVKPPTGFAIGIYSR